MEGRLNKVHVEPSVCLRQRAISVSVPASKIHMSSSEYMAYPLELPISIIGIPSQLKENRVFFKCGTNAIRFLVFDRRVRVVFSSPLMRLPSHRLVRGISEVKKGTCYLDPGLHLSHTIPCAYSTLCN